MLAVNFILFESKSGFISKNINGGYNGKLEGNKLCI